MDEQNILITGGTKGIGRELVTFYSKKCNIVFFFYKNSEDLCKELENTYDNVKGYKVDVANHDECEKIINTILNKYNKIDILINNAGILLNKKLMDMVSNEWVQIINTNLVSLFNITKYVLPIMKAQKYGRIINISSISGLKGYSGQTAYSSSKMGIIGFTKSLAKEVGSYNILVNSISPGFIETEILKNINEDYRNNIKNQIHVKKFGNVNEISNVVNMLIESQYITGENIIIDGGLIN